MKPGTITATMVTFPVAEGVLAAQCPWCEVTVAAEGSTECPHLIGRDEGFTDVRLKFAEVRCP